MWISATEARLWCQFITVLQYLLRLRCPIYYSKSIHMIQYLKITINLSCGVLAFLRIVSFFGMSAVTIVRSFKCFFAHLEIITLIVRFNINSFNILLYILSVLCLTLVLHSFFGQQFVMKHLQCNIRIISNSFNEYISRKEFN